MKHKKIEFPKECCGVCFYCVPDEKTHLCMAEPPYLVEDEEGMTVGSRGVPTEQEHVACRFFKARMHA